MGSGGNVYLTRCRTRGIDGQFCSINRVSRIRLGDVGEVGSASVVPPQLCDVPPSPSCHPAHGRPYISQCNVDSLKKKRTHINSWQSLGQSVLFDNLA